MIDAAPRPRRTAARAASRGRASEADLIRLAANGDREAFARVVRTHDQLLRSVAGRIITDRNRLDDVMQETYVKAYRHLPSFDPSGPAKLSTWLYGIARNCAIDERRRQQRLPDPVDDEVRPAVDPSASKRTDHRLDAAALRRAFRSIDPDLAAIVALVDGEGMTQIDAAEWLGISRRAVQLRLDKARTELRSILVAEGYQP